MAQQRRAELASVFIAAMQHQSHSTEAIMLAHVPKIGLLEHPNLHDSARQLQSGIADKASPGLLLRILLHTFTLQLTHYSAEGPVWKH